MTALVTRRRVIGIAGAAAGLSLVPLARPGRAETALATWRGTTMGALAHLQIHHSERATAERLIQLAVAEMRRIERIFSLYRDDSALVALNREQVLVAPPVDLVLLLGECRRLSELTGGAFDPTVQALWSLYYEHFLKEGHDPRGPSAESVEAALEKVGFRYVSFDRSSIVLGRRGMALTLNGIAQGFATDRVIEMLRSEGVEHSFVDIGEGRALGNRSDGRPWRVGIAEPDAPERVAESFELVDKAVATTGAYGFRFDPDGRFNHLLDPKTGRSPNLYRSVTVIAATATIADGLSTAFSAMERGNIEPVLRAFDELEVRLTLATGERKTLSSPRA